MEIIEPITQLISQLTYSKDVPIWEFTKTVGSVSVLIIGSGFTAVKYIKSRKDKKIEAEEIKKEKKRIEDEMQEKIKRLKARVKDDLIFIHKKLSSKDLITIISDNTISSENMHSINEYMLFLLNIEPIESRDYLSIKNLFEKNETIKNKLNKYINVRSRGINKSGLYQDPDFGILEKNYSELEKIIKEKILTL